MSYDRTLFIGWYLEYSPSSATAPDSPVEKRRCSADKKHKLPGGKEKFCPHCGAEVVTEKIDKRRKMGEVHHYLNEESRSEVEYGTLGRGTVEDMRQLAQGFAIFPEDFPADKRIIMLPGYQRIEDVGRSGGFDQEIDTTMGAGKTANMLAYIELLKKVFDVQNTHLKFGVVMDIR